MKKQAADWLRNQILFTDWPRVFCDLPFYHQLLKISLFKKIITKEERPKVIRFILDFFSKI